MLVMSATQPEIWSHPIIGTPPQHCSAIATRVNFADRDGSIPEGAILLSTDKGPADSRKGHGAITKRAFGYKQSGDKSLLTMTPVYRGEQVVKGSFPLVAGVASDVVAPSSRGKGNVISSTYIHGACNVRCKIEESKTFRAGDLIYVAADRSKGVLYAMSQETCDKDGVTRLIAGILGTCLENGEEGKPFVRVFVDNSFNTMLACC